MELVGDKTMSIYSRYAIADESMLKDTAGKLERLHESDKFQSKGKVMAK